MKKILFTALAIIAVACTKEEEPCLNFGEGQNSTLTLPASGASETISFTANNSWTATSSADWLTINPASGEAGAQNVKITASANTDYDSRTATITITSQEVSRTVSVTQRQLEELLVGTTAFEIGSIGGELKIPVKSSIEYAVEVLNNASWIKIASAQTKALEDYFLTLSIEANSEYDARTGQVRIRGEEKESVVTITQSQLEGFVLEKTEYEIDNIGGEIIIPVKSNIEYTVEVINGASEWITISDTQTKSLEESSIRLVIAENKSYDGRTGQIKISGKDRESVVSIIQSQVDALLVAESEITKSYEAGTAELKLQTNIAYIVEIPTEAQSWLSVVETKAMHDEMITFSFSFNDGEERKTKVRIMDKQGYVMQNVQIIQLKVGEVIVETEAGKLEESLSGYDPTKISSLKIIGMINDEDFEFIRDLPLLNTLDISDVNISAIPDGGFSYNNSVNISLPKALTTIGAFAFSDCKSLKSIEIPASVETIGENAFIRCTSLKSVTFQTGSKLKSIRESAFYDCSLLFLIIIPASVETIEVEAFKGCESLSHIYFENNSKLSKINNRVFYCLQSLKSIEIPASVETIGENAFARCTSLESVTFEANSKLKTIGGGVGPYSTDVVYTSRYMGVFFDCKSLKSIEIPASVETIEAGAFEGCESLESVTFEANSKLKTIGGGVGPYKGGSYNVYTTRYIGAFTNCKSLKSIEIPASVETIEAGAFVGCESISSVTFESGSQLKMIDGIVEHDGYITYYYGAFTGLLKLEVDMSQCKLVESIGPGAFYGCGYLPFKIGTIKPPTCGREAFVSVFASELKVPSESIDAYKAADGWGRFGSITALDE